MKSTRVRRGLGAAALTLLCAAALADDGTATAPASPVSPSATNAGPLSDWVRAADSQARLQAGEVVVQSGFDAQQASVHVDAAVRIQAPAQAIWPLITRCDSASLLIPGLRHCKELSSAPDGSWAVVEHDIKFAAMLPIVHSVFHADYQAPFRMDFHRIAGDMKDEVGTWTLQPSADGQSTTIEYRVAMQPGFFVPHTMVRHSLKKQLPAALIALRKRAEHPPTPLAKNSSSAQ
jgi:hypothetical protein